MILWRVGKTRTVLMKSKKYFKESHDQGKMSDCQFSYSMQQECMQMVIWQLSFQKFYPISSIFISISNSTITNSISISTSCIELIQVALIASFIINLATFVHTGLYEDLLMISPFKCLKLSQGIKPAEDIPSTTLAIGTTAIINSIIDITIRSL